MTAVVALMACSEPEATAVAVEERQLIEKNGVVFGEVWDGPEKALYSQANEELIVRDFFEDRREGVFLDVGSAAPIVDSTTYYLEKHLGWTGIAVDALAEYAPEYARARPATQFVSYIVTDHSGTREKFYRARAANLSSTDPNRQWAGKPVETEMIEVPTITLDELIAQERLGRADFLSLDIEGSEAKALTGFDLVRHRPELVCVEVAKANRPFVERYFADRGYERVEKYARFDFVNWYSTPVTGNGGEDGS